MNSNTFSTVQKNLEARGYRVQCFSKTEDAVRYLDRTLDGQTIGFGGSMTLEEMGLYEVLAPHNTVYWHQRIPEGQTCQQVRLSANAAPFYISSVNGLAETGEMINIDGNCNRVASIFYGHTKVYLIIGINKLAKDYESALYRARHVAAPRNAQRIGAKPPCAISGDRCYDCQSADRICCGLSVLWGKPMTGEFEILLIQEELGY